MRRSSRFFFVLVAATFFTLAVQAEGPQVRKAKEPWEWTDEERLAQRYDPDSIWERNQASLAEMTDQGADARLLEAMEENQIVRIHGNRNPELFMPWELFQQLISTAFAADAETREAWRLIYRQQSDEVLLTDAFWQNLEKTAGDYLVLVVREQEFVKVLNQTEGEARQTLIANHVAHRNEQEQCSRMMEAFQQVRQSVGEAVFSRVLYEAVAPSTFISHPLARGPEALLYVQGGCR